MINRELSLFYNRYNFLLEHEKEFCFYCIPDIVKTMNEKYKTEYSEEQVENWLFGEIQIKDAKLQFENLGIEI